MKTKATLILLTGASAMLAACGSGGGILGRDRPDEFAVQRQAPLVVPPDFSLTPPAPGTPRPAEGTAAEQTLQALFGGPAPRSSGEMSMLESAGRDRAALGIRSTAGSPDTRVVDKGQATQTIIAAPESDGQDASAHPGVRPRRYFLRFATKRLRARRGLCRGVGDGSKALPKPGGCPAPGV